MVDEVPISNLKQSPKVPFPAGSSTYAANSKNYQKVIPDSLTPTKLLAYIKDYNIGKLSIHDICNLEVITIKVFREAIKKGGFSWDVSTKSYIPKSDLKYTKRSRVVRTPFTKVKLDPVVHRMLVLQATLEKIKIEQLLNNLIERSVTTEVRKLAATNLPITNKLLS